LKSLVTSTNISLKLSNLFSDGAVLQRRKPLTIWGWAKPGDFITVELGELKGYAEAGDRGKFECRLPSLEADGETYSLKVSNDSSSIEIHGLVVGEVWLASGQSNMSWTLEQCHHYEELIKTIDQHDFRYFKTGTRIVPNQIENPIGEWQKASPQSSGDFSAVASFFALKLIHELKLPVGIIESSHGGTAIEAWSRRESLLNNSEIAPSILRYGLDVCSNPSLKERDEQEGLPKDPGSDLNPTLIEPNSEALDHFNTMELPAPWQDRGLSHSGVVWFYYKLELPIDWLGDNLELHLGAIDKQDQVWVNGIKVGSTGHHFEDEHIETLRQYSLTSNLTANQELLFAIRVYSFHGYGGLLGPKDEMKLVHSNGQKIPLCGNWSYQVEHDFGVIAREKPLGKDRASSPHLLYDTMIKPLQPYALGGFIWYQGERNASRHQQYRRLLSDLIEDWRREWGDSDLPFGIVQLPNYQEVKAFDENNSWANFRQSQLETSLSLKNVGLAVTIDLGEANNIHPTNKQPVGERLARWALVDHYGQSGVKGGPVFKHQTIEGTKIRLYFTQSETGLQTTDDKKPSGFWIQDRNSNWRAADATIHEQTVLVSHPDVKDPISVRYAWAANPEFGNLCNGASLPASPFRSDPQYT